MKRKTSSAPTRIWSFGARPPTAEAERVRDQFWRASRYYNRLIEIERRRLDEYRITRSSLDPELGALESDARAAEERVESVIQAIRDHRRRTVGAHLSHTGKVAKTREIPAELAEQLAAARATAKSAHEAAKERRTAFEGQLAAARDEEKRRVAERGEGTGPRVRERVRADVVAEMLNEEWSDAWKLLRQIDDRALTERKRARADSGLSPGTGIKVDEAVDQAIKTARPAPPKFRRYDGGGRVVVQLRDTTVATLLDCSSQHFQLVPSVRQGARGNQEQYFVARIRVGSDSKKAPVWADFPVKIHRMPPLDAVVKWAWVVARRQGESMRFELQLTMEHASFAEAKRPSGEGEVHVRVGWTTVPSGVRVAQWNDGEHVESDYNRGAHGHAARLRSHADTHYDSAQRVVRLVTKRSGNRLLHWERMRSDQKRLAFRRLCREYAEHVLTAEGARSMWVEWKRGRLSHGADLFAPLTVVRRWMLRKWPARMTMREPATALAFWLLLWTRKDEHLRTYHANASRRTEAQREARYRRTAIRLATQYETLALDKMSIAELAKLPEVDEPNPIAESSRSNRHALAPGRFREILCEVFGPNRIRWIERSGGAKKPGRARKASKTLESAAV